MIKTAVRWLITVAMVTVGVLHFVRPDDFVTIVPDVLPAKLALVYVSGVAEIAGGLGLILPATRRWAAWGLIALYVAVFPANINMAVNQLPLGDQVLAPWQLWARLPFQLVFIALAYWMTRPDATAETSTIR
jgi:uncharacterized membrane protein